MQIDCTSVQYFCTQKQEKTRMITGKMLLERLQNMTEKQLEEEIPVECFDAGYVCEAHGEGCSIEDKEGRSGEFKIVVDLMCA